MKFLMIALITISLVSCATTAPDGTRELSADIEHDRSLRMQGDRKDLVGKPVFLKVRAYPQIRDGNIHGPHWILLQVKREPLDLDGLIDTLEE
ncbi:MAG: hypothetical protein H6618_08845 [Deltaproteobacteria bacterium]|nr:hypothetical protein [Deltaproteobacteria bacterium]